MGLIKQLNQEYQSKFISIREAFEAIKEVSPASTEAEIAKLLIRALFSDEHNKNEAEIQPFTGVITSIDASSSQTLELEGLLEIISTEKVSIAELDNLWFYKLESFGVREFFYTGQADNLGWYREGFNEALKKNGLDIEAIQQQKSEEGLKHHLEKLELSLAASHTDKAFNSRERYEDRKRLIELESENKKLKQQLEDSAQEELPTEPPAWLKPYMARAYLSLEEASDIITRVEFYDDQDGFNRAYPAYKEMLRRNVMEGLIRLSPNAGNVTDYEEYWQLDVNDIGKLCSTINILWPISYVKNEANTNSNQTVVNDPEFNARLEELKAANEALKAENEALKAENEALKERLDNNLCINPDSELLSKEALVGLKAWIAVTNNGQEEVGFKKTPKQQLVAKIEELIKQNPNQYCISDTGKERVGTVFNWKPEGGSPKTGK